MLDCLHCPLSLTISLGVLGAACLVMKLVVFSKVLERLAVKLLAVVYDNHFRYVMSGKHAFHLCDDLC